MKDKTPVVKQLYRLNVEPRVVDQLTKLATRTGETPDISQAMMSRSWQHLASSMGVDRSRRFHLPRMYPTAMWW